MKYETNTKIERNKAIVALWKSNTNLSMKEIGGFFNITKQRVSQIIKRQIGECK